MVLSFFEQPAGADAAWDRNELLCCLNSASPTRINARNLPNLGIHFHDRPAALAGVDSCRRLNDIQELAKRSRPAGPTRRCHPVVRYQPRETVFAQGDRCADVLLLLANFDAHHLPCAPLPAISRNLPADVTGTTRYRVDILMNKFRKLGFIERVDGGVQVNRSLLTMVTQE